MKRTPQTQVEGLIRTIDDRADCQDYIQRLRDAGHGSPYEGATEMIIAHTYDAAGKAGCVKVNWHISAQAAGALHTRRHSQLTVYKFREIFCTFLSD